MIMMNVIVIQFGTEKKSSMELVHWVANLLHSSKTIIKKIPKLANKKDGSLK